MRRFDAEQGTHQQQQSQQSQSYGGADLGRKKSLVRPERNRIDQSHPNYYYRRHVQQGRLNVLPSTTGNEPSIADSDEQHTLKPEKVEVTKPLKQKRSLPSPWKLYCAFVTFWAPSAVLSCCGMPNKKRQSAWREKIGIISIILMIGSFVGFLTFGFTKAVCGTPAPRLRINEIDNGFLIINGRAYDLTNSHHPGSVGVPAGSNVLYPPVNDGGKDVSFMFQNVNAKCKNIIKAAKGSDVPTQTDGSLAWYFPCVARKQDGSTQPNLSYVPPYSGYACHTSSEGRNAYYNMKVTGEVYFSWSDISNQSRNLIVYSGSVIDLDLITWFNTSQVSIPDRFYEWANNSAIRGLDMTRSSQSSIDKELMNCLVDIAKAGSVDTETVGCIASKVVLYISLVFIVAIVVIKFLLALLFNWFLSRHSGAKRSGAFKDMASRRQAIEEWSDDIYRPGPNLRVAKRPSTFFPKTSRFTSPYAVERPASGHSRFLQTMSNQSNTAKVAGSSATIYSHGNSSHYSMDKFARSTSQSSLSLLGNPAPQQSDTRFSNVLDEGPGPAGFVHEAVVPQPPPEYEPFNFPLAHSILLVTAYSESMDGVRTTLDSLATTDYPNSHKLILVICDGLIRGHGNQQTTPEIVLSMMKDFAVPRENVEAYSYVAVASGSRRHNMAKVYAGFYAYDDSTIDQSKQQRVPMMTIVKCGTTDEEKVAKPGNRGKRDSQIILMSFLQKVMFDERMTELEYEMFNGIWKITGIAPDFYETALMVDADTKVFPDALTHMIAAMVYDPNLMGLCGETKIANKKTSWITMIQVFEYFISHHLTKAFESVFGGVTCLPGCFCMYRIKAPKGPNGYWVPILANPDVVEHYSENVVETLHDKNLLLLGEDRYLSTLMLKTFPKRKQVFVPQAVCKTTVPESLKVLMSQRRRWINSTVHNLMELVLVRDLCGTFCFSMQFVVFIELIGTLVLPAAIAFTFYLIIISIIPSNPTPVIPLILLALVLGLPGVLIIMTASRWSYVLWMLVYLLSLPIWNFVLPVYAYWHMDEFSWGDTRKIAGGGGEEDEEGDFDGSHIVMKKWRDFERERRHARVQ